MIRVEHFNKKYGEHVVFHDFSFCAAEGERVGLKGASGCGKTTLLRCLSGLDPDYTGTIELDGKRMDERVHPDQRNIALVMQEPVLWPHMTVKENILYPIKRRDLSGQQKVLEEMCRNLQITELMGRYPNAISGGQAKRVSLCRAILSGKGILLLDEPLSNVDPETKERVVLYLRNHYLEKKTILYVSHDQKELEQFCSRIENLD